MIIKNTIILFFCLAMISCSSVKDPPHKDDDFESKVHENYPR